MMFNIILDMASAIYDRFSFAHHFDQETHAMACVESQSISMEQCAEQTEAHLKNLFGIRLTHYIFTTIDILHQHHRWPLLSVPHVPRYMHTIQDPLPTQSPMLEMAKQQLQQELQSLPQVSRQPFFEQFIQFNQHVQKVHLLIKNLTQCIQKEKSMSFKKKQLMYDIIRLAKQWVFRISAHCRQMLKERWNIFIIFNSKTHLPEVQMAFSPQRILSTNSKPAQIMHFLAHLYLVLKAGCNPNLKAFMPSEEMFQEFITVYPSSKINCPDKNPFEVHTPLINYMYILIFSHIHNMGIQEGLRLCYQLLSNWKGRIIQSLNNEHQQDCVPTIHDLFVFVRFDAVLPIPPYFFNPEQRYHLTTTMCHLISECHMIPWIKSKVQGTNMHMHNVYFVHDVVTAHQQNCTSLPDPDEYNSIRLIKKLLQNARKKAQENKQKHDDIIALHHSINRAIYEVALMEENLCYANETPLCPYMNSSLPHARSSQFNAARNQIHLEHFYQIVHNYMNFDLIFDLHAWNMQSVKKAPSKIYLHNEQNPHNFRSSLSQFVILGLYEARVNLSELQINVYERYGRSLSPSYITVMNDIFVSILRSIMSNIKKNLTFSSILLEACLCDLKTLFDTIDSTGKTLTIDFFENFFSADHYTYSTFDSWFPQSLSKHSK